VGPSRGYKIFFGTKTKPFFQFYVFILQPCHNCKITSSSVACVSRNSFVSVDRETHFLEGFCILKTKEYHLCLQSLSQPTWFQVRTHSLLFQAVVVGTCQSLVLCSASFSSLSYYSWALKIVKCQVKENVLF
jgi:hypothetical protein